MLFGKQVIPFLALPFVSLSAFAGANQQTANQQAAQQTAQEVHVIAGQEGQTLDQLRAQCEAFSKDDQIEAFKIRIACAGSYRVVEIVRGQVALRSSTKITMSADTKDGRYNSAAVEVAGLIKGANQAPAETVFACNKYVEKEISSPKGTPLTKEISHCEDLTAAKVEGMCADLVEDFCSNHLEVQQSAQAGQQSAQASQQVASGKCTETVVREIDACPKEVK